VRQILINLIGNAIKFTREGSIQVKAAFSGNGEDEGQLVLTVRDTGIGMDEVTQQQVFKAFVQGDTGIRRQYGGTGIGLTISQRLTELLGGTISLQSKPRKGTTFTVHLPAAIIAQDRIPQQEKTQPLQHDEHLAPARVLIVDDDPWNREVLQSMLKDEVAIIECAIDGFEALHKVRKQPFDLLLMDVHMHHLNGFETSQAISHEPLEWPAPTILYLTADTRDETTQRALKTNGERVLHKPITRKRLLEALTETFIERTA
jgi:two-component system, sensor histidine kinase